MPDFDVDAVSRQPSAQFTLKEGSGISLTPDGDDVVVSSTVFDAGGDHLGMNTPGSAQTLTTGNDTVMLVIDPVAYDPPFEDTLGEWDYGSGQLTSVAGGIYSGSAHVEFAANTTGYRSATFAIDVGNAPTFQGVANTVVILPGSPMVQDAGDGTNVLSLTVSFAFLRLYAGNRLYLLARHTRGANLDVAVRELSIMKHR